MNFREKYGDTALIAGASEGIGAAFARALASRGMNVILIARRKEPLEKTASEIEKKFGVRAMSVVCDLADENALEKIQSAIGDVEVNLLVYNAALSPIGPFLKLSDDEMLKVASINMLTPMKFAHAFGARMIEKRKGAIVLITSLAGFQGSGYLAMYSATKAFNRMLAESLWYEWKNKGVDVIACVAGATSTPGYIQSKPKSAGMFAPRVQQPHEVAEECLKKLGRVPSFISGRGNRVASFFMQNIFSRKTAVKIMGDATKKIYSVED
ncbi:MAG: SDR family NAD(P)-dependent oxidoreductase [Chitinophagales bacterium]